jgi:site-specific DNA recombinase
LEEADRNLSEKTALLEAHKGEIQKIKDEIGKTHKLYLADQISVEGFGAIAKPAEARLSQLNAELPKLEAEVDFMRVNKLSADDVMHEANTMYDQWPTLAIEDKRKVMEALVEKVTIGNGEIDITFSCVPSSEDVCKSQRGLGLGRGEQNSQKILRRSLLLRE